MSIYKVDGEEEERLLKLIKNNRYFLVTFNPDNRLAFGSITLECEDFFSYNFLLRSIRDIDSTINSVVVINIFEFRTKADYLSYIRQQD